jgi:hypothetical protein
LTDIKRIVNKAVDNGYERFGSLGPQAVSSRRVTSVVTKVKMRSCGAGDAEPLNQEQLTTGLSLAGASDTALRLMGIDEACSFL